MCLLGVTFVLGLLILIPPIYADCPTSFFAEDVAKDEVSSYKFYFTGRSIKSAADCARFCARRQFCRTALFDETASTCAITYDLRTFCHVPTTRFNSFTSKSTGLVAISCVDYCPSEDQNGPTGSDSILKSTTASAGIRSGKSAVSTGPTDPVLVVSFVTAPKDTKGSDSILTSTAASARIPSGQSAASTVAADPVLVVSFVTAPKDLKGGDSIPTSTGASAGIPPGQNAASAGPADPVLVVSVGTAPKGSKDDSITPKTLVIRTSSAHLSTTSTSTDALTTSSNAPSTTTTEYTGPSFITASNLGELNPSGDDEKPFSPMDIGIAEAPCFAFQPRKALVNAVFATELVNSLEECKCLCASSWLSNRYLGSNCKSVQYSARSRECHLNTADHMDGNLQHVGDDQGDYYWFKCYRTEHAVTNFVLNECRGLLPAPLGPSGADPTAPCFEVINGYLIKGTAGGLEHDVSLEQCQCYCAHSQTSGRYAFQCLSATYYHQERDCVLNLDNRINRTDLYDKNDKAQYSVSYMGMTCTPDRARAHFPSGAVGVSNDAAEQVCGRFDGRTLVIHPITSDTKYALVTESSVTANGEVGSENLIRASSKSVDTVGQKHTPSTGVRVGIALKPGVNSDPCFLELPNYVLEGMALAIETKVTVEACKCYCVGAEKRYGAVCQSFQYYYDSKTCLINRENRISHPDRFDIDPSFGPPHSYFDYRCAANGVVLDVYVDTTCEGLNIDISIPKDSQSSFPVESAPVNFVTSESPSGSSTFGSAFITADPNEAEESTPKKSAPSFPVESNPVKFGKFRWGGFKRGGSRTTSGAAFITADPNDVEESTASGPGGFVSSAIEAPEIISSGGGKPPSFEPSVVTLASPRGRTPIIHQRLVSPRAEILRSDTSATLAPLPLAFEMKTGQPKKTTTTVGSTTEVLSTTSEASTSSSTTTTERTTTEEKTTTAETTTETPSTTTAESITESSTSRTFKPVGPCRYSAIYQTAFQGSKMVERLEVTSPAQCFSACKEVGCRSANLIQSNGVVKHCELFRDSLIDYRTSDVLEFDGGTVYFDGIECSQKL